MFPLEKISGDGFTRQHAVANQQWCHNALTDVHGMRSVAVEWDEIGSSL
jgi:hypothetical protein